MRRMICVALTGLLTLVPGTTVRADEKSEAMLADLTKQLREMRAQMQQLQQENQRLQSIVAHQQQGDRVVLRRAEPQGLGSVAPARLFEDEAVLRIEQRPGAAPPSWLDLLIEQNRQRTLEAIMKARANERLADERLAKITAESKAVGVTYCPRPLRETALAGGDVKKFRDEYAAARSADFDALFNQVHVKEYLKSKVARLSNSVSRESATDGWHVGNGIAPATAHLVDRLRTDLEDATILYGSAGLHGAAPAGLAMADQLTRRMRHSRNPHVSGVTRETLEMGRRAAAVDEAVANDMDIELVLRMQQVREVRRRMITGGYVPTAAQINEDIAQANDALNGKVTRTRIPEVQAFTGFDARRD